MASEAAGITPQDQERAHGLALRVLSFAIKLHEGKEYDTCSCGPCHAVRCVTDVLRPALAEQRERDAKIADEGVCDLGCICCENEREIAAAIRRGDA